MKILYIDIDTLRPDHLGCYGYGRNTSPNIDRLAAEGVRLDNCYTSDAPCLPSRTALMTGKFGIHTGAINHNGFNADRRPEGRKRRFVSEAGRDTLPAFLQREAKLHTAYIGGFGERHSSYDFYAGFREINDTGKEGMESAEEVTPAVLEWLDRNGGKDDWYLHLNYWDPHAPYRTPEEFGNPFAHDPLPEWLTQQVIDRQSEETVGPHSIREIRMFGDDENLKYPRQPGKATDMKDVRRVIDGYDCGVRYVDEHIGRVLEKLDSFGILDDTVVIVSSDHGENLGELGFWCDHASADQMTCRVPMIIRWPGMKRNHADRDLHYQLDLLPTLADLLGLKPRPSWDGQSYAPVLRDGMAAGREELILSQCCHVCQRSVRWGDWLHIRTYHDFFHLFPREMLFNLAADPHEQHDLASARPDICDEAARRYLAWHDEMMMTQPEGYFHDPLWEVMHTYARYAHLEKLAPYCERLEKTGRAWAIPRLKERHPGGFE